MGWFDEQIRQRKQNDQDVFEESIFRMASVVLGKSRAGALNDERIVTKAAIDDILKYYHAKPVEIPGSIQDADEALEYCQENWYHDAFGPMIAFRKDDKLPVALMPKPVIGYWFHDPVSGEKKTLNKTTASQFDQDAICFYRPLPLKKLGIPDLLRYLAECLDIGDYVWLAVLTLAVTGFGMVLTPINRMLTSFVLDSGSRTLLAGTAVFMLTSIVAGQLMTIARELMMNRVEIKTSLAVEASIMMRIMNLPANFFRKFSSGELSSRSGAVSQLCTLLLGSVFSGGLTSLASLLYVTQIFRYAPALVTPAIIIKRPRHLRVVILRTGVPSQPY